MNLIQLLTDQWAYKGITHSRWGAPWNWWWRRVGDDEERRSPSPEPQTDSRSGLPMKNRRWWQLRLVDRDNSFALIFSRKIGFYSASFRVCRAARWGQPTWARLGGRRALVGCSHPGSPLRWLLAPEILFYCIKKSWQSFVPFRELLFLHKNNTMVVLLKTASVRVSFIQIMQIRVQNKRKSGMKSRYVGHVSTPPSLNLCLSSSNSVDKLKVKKKNFYELFFSCLHK